MTTGRYSSLIKNRYFVSFAIAVLFLLVRIYFLLSTDNFYGAVPAYKIMYSLTSRGNIFGPIDESSPILYMYLLKAWLGIFNNVYTSPRILSLLFGLLTLIPLFLMVRLIKGESCALITMFTIATFPLHIIFSTLSTEEAAFHFIIFLSLYLFHKYKYISPRMVYLILSALLITSSFGFRFEGVLYSIVMPLFLLKEKDKKRIFIFSVISISLPMLWFGLCQKRFHNPLISFMRQSLYASLEIGTGYNLRFIGKSILKSILSNFSIPLLLLGAFGYLMSIKDKKMNIINVIFSLFLLMTTVKVLTKTLFWQDRYMFSFSLFFLIYASIGLLRFSKYIRNNISRVAFILIFIVYSLFFALDSINNSKTDYFFYPELKRLINFAKDKESILIDVEDYHEYPEVIAVYSGIDLRRVKIVQEIKVHNSAIIEGPGLACYKKYLLEMINNRSFNYIMYAPAGRSLRWLFPLDSEEEYIGEVKYRRVVRGEKYWVYKLVD